MGWQDFLTFAVVGFAVAYLVYKFALEPRLRARRPHVATRSIVRRHRKASNNDCCH